MVLLMVWTRRCDVTQCAQQALSSPHEQGEEKSDSRCHRDAPQGSLTDSVFDFFDRFDPAVIDIPGLLFEHSRAALRGAGCIAEQPGHIVAKLAEAALQFLETG
jgi:hypothetical protein